MPTLFNLFDSDGNAIVGPITLEHLPAAIASHYQLVADTTRLNRAIGVDDASEPFLTIVPVASREEADAILARVRDGDLHLHEDRLNELLAIEAGD